MLAVSSLTGEIFWFFLIVLQLILRNMDESNCLGIHCFAEIHSCNDLMNKAKKYVLKHFQEIIMGDEFINITETKLIEIISSDDLEVDKGIWLYEWIEITWDDVSIKLFARRDSVSREHQVVEQSTESS